MATVTSIAAGNYYADRATVWDTGNIPAADDNVVYNHAVTWDVGATVRLPAVSGVFASISFGATGQLIVGGFAGDLSLNSTTIQGGAIGTGGSIAYTASTCTSLTINANGGITGCASGGTNPYCILKTATKPLTINGPLIGGAVTNSHALYINGTGAIVINGAITGGAGGHGMNSNIGVPITVSGTVTGGTGTSKFGIALGVTNYTFSLLSGNVVAGSVANTNGIWAVAVGTGSLTLHSACNLIDTATATAYNGPIPIWTPNADVYHQMGSLYFAKQVLATDLKVAIKNGTITGTYAPRIVNGVTC